MQYAAEAAAAEEAKQLLQTALQKAQQKDLELLSAADEGVYVDHSMPVITRLLVCSVYKLHYQGYSREYAICEPSADYEQQPVLAHLHTKGRRPVV